MINRILFLFFILLSFSGHTQLSDANKELLRTELVAHVNELRISLGLPALIEHDILQKAAALHSTYMAKYDVLSHDEKKRSLSTPARRVKKSGSKDFEIVGENILFTAEQDFPLKKKEIIALAASMFQQWKNSPGHYANMIDPEYTHGDFGFKTQTKKKIVYATQVFGKPGIRIEGQLSRNAFGIRPAQEDCDVAFRGIQNLVTNMCNGVYIEGNEIHLYFHNLELFKRILSGAKDGLAIDLVSRAQLECGKPNQLDFSPVHDGILLEPTFRKELLDNNVAESKYRLITQLGTIPESMRGQELMPSLIIIKNGLKCKYLVPASAPSKNYDLRPIPPVVENPEGVELVRKGVIHSEELNYEFKTNITTPVRYPKIEGKGKVHSINIVSYSSIEGDSLKNIALHKARGNTIKKHLTGKLKTGGAPISIETYENWAKMNFQLNYLFADSLTLWSKQELRDLIASGDTTLYWDSLLYDQRKSTANINYYGELEIDAPLLQKTEMSLMTALATGNTRLAQKALYTLYHKDLITPDILFSGYTFDVLKTQPELVQNASAVLSKYFDYNIYKTTEFINSWLQRADELKPEALTNLLHLYTLTGEQLLKDWDISAKRLSNVIHPTKIATLIHEDISSELMLNIQLTFLQYYGHTNNSPGINESFDFIRTYFTNNNLPIEDVKDLVKFFNKWSRYDLTNSLLLPMFNDGELDTEATFILAHTMNKYQYKTNTDDLLLVHQKAVELDRVQWCKWVDDEFQILRNHKIKRTFCEVCD